MNKLLEGIKTFATNNQKLLITAGVTIVGAAIGVAIGTVVANAVAEEMRIYEAAESINLEIGEQDLA